MVQILIRQLDERVVAILRAQAQRRRVSVGAITEEQFEGIAALAPGLFSELVPAAPCCRRPGAG